jgi:ribonuclease HI
MAVLGRSTLRDLFDDSPTPHIAHPPRTHQRQFYVATDGSYRPNGGGLGAVIETRDGERVARVALPDTPPNNNVAEYRALHLGLDVLAERVPADARVGVLVDHDQLAGNVNQAVLSADDPDWRSNLTMPTGTQHHWRGIKARIAGFGALRAARIDGRNNPAHPLANEPQSFTHVNRQSPRCVLPASTKSDDSDDTQIPPPSRAERRAGD